MIGSFQEINEIASRSKPVKAAIIAPEDREFILAVKQAKDQSLIDPVFLGRRKLIAKVAEKVRLDLDPQEIVEIEDRQAVADHALQMLYQGDVHMVSKGQIPTEFIYRSVIKTKKEHAEGTIVSVITVWDIKNCDHLVLLSDPGANIKPSEAQKLEIVDNAVKAAKVLGCQDPKAIELISDPTNLYIKSEPDQEIKTPTIRQYRGKYNLADATSLKGVLIESVDRKINLNNLPHILLFPGLDTGNVVAKLDFLIKNIVRVSFTHTSRGPVLLPSRADAAESILREITFGVGLVALQRRNIS